MKMFLTQYCIIWVSTVKGYKYAVNMLNNYKYDFFWEVCIHASVLRSAVWKQKILFRLQMPMETLFHIKWA